MVLMWTVITTLAVGGPALTASDRAARLARVERPGVRDLVRDMPLAFEAAGGRDGAKEFFARGPGYAVRLGAPGAVLTLVPLSSDAQARGPAIVHMALDGGDRGAAAEALEPLSARFNYFVGKDPAGWRTRVPSYGRVLYRNVYPGIDVVYYGSQRRLEFDFVVHPGADPRRIAMTFDGVAAMEADEQGDVVLRIDGREVRVRKPVVYQDLSGVRREVDGRYAVTGPRQARFVLAAYDARQTLVIDPAVAYSTYFGGSGEDTGVAVATDGAGKVYIAGATASLTLEGVSPILHGVGGVGGTLPFHDAFVAEFDPAQSGPASLVFASVIGGAGDDVATGVAVDATGIYVAGYADANSMQGFPTTAGAFLTQTPFGVNGSAFLTKLAPNGAALDYSTFLVQSADGVFTRASALGLDGNGHAYVLATSLYAVGMPTTPGAANTAPPSGSCAQALARFNAVGSQLDFSTYLPGCHNALAVDGAGNAFLTGASGSDTLVLRADSVGALTTATLTGGEGRGIDVDAAGDVYVARDIGGTSALVTKIDGGSLSAPPVATLYDTSLALRVSAFVPAPLAVDRGSGEAYLVGRDQTTFDWKLVKLDPSGSSNFVFPLPLGGLARAVAAGSGGSVYIAGTTMGSLATTPSAFDATCGTAASPCSSSGVSDDAFVMVVSPDALSGLGVTVSGSPDPVLAGQPATFTATVTNAGPSPATQVVLTLGVSAGATVVSATPSTGTCSGSGPIVCTLGSLATSGSAGVTLVLSSSACGVITATAGVAAAEPDPDPTNNQATATVAIEKTTDLSVSVAASRGFVVPGSSGNDTVAFTVAVHNASAVYPATAVRLTVTVPYALELLGVTPAVFGCSSFTVSGIAQPTSVVCNFASLGPGGTTSITLNARGRKDSFVDYGPAVVTAKVANVSATCEVDPLPADNTATATVDLVNTPSGMNVTVDATDPTNPNTAASTGVTLTFAIVSQPGQTTAQVRPTGPPPPANFKVAEPAVYFDLHTTAVTFGTIRVCIPYGAGNPPPVLYHDEGLPGSPNWVAAQNQVVDTVNFRVCGDVNSLSPFAAFLPVNRAPVCSGARANPSVLWPPDHRLVPVTIADVTDPDGDGVQIGIDGVTESDLVAGPGAGHTDVDWIIHGSTVLLRAERSGGGAGRLYTISFGAADGMGGTCRGTATVSVPHDRRP